MMQADEVCSQLSTHLQDFISEESVPWWWISYIFTKRRNNRVQWKLKLKPSVIFKTYLNIVSFGTCFIFGCTIFLHAVNRLTGLGLTFFDQLYMGSRTVWMLLTECSESISHNHTAHIKKCPDSIVGKRQRPQAFLIYSYVISMAIGTWHFQYYNLNTIGFLYLQMVIYS